MGKVEQSETPDESEFEYPILEREPDEIWFAIRVTALMTQLGRNVSNRRGGLQSMSQEAFSFNGDIVTAGLMITTVADEVQFDHHDVPQTKGLGTESVARVVDKLSEAAITRGDRSSNLNGIGLIVFDYDGRSEPEVYRNAPAPDPDSRLNYDNFISNLSDLIDQRFLGLPDPQSAGVDEFLERNEGRTIEFKRDFSSIEARDLAREAVAMINTDGGVILLGVDDGGNPVGVEDPDDERNSAANTLRKYIEDAPSITLDQETVDGEDILLIRLPKAEDRLYSLEGEFLTRFGESNMPMEYRELKQFVINWIVDRHRLDELVSE